MLDATPSSMSCREFERHSATDYGFSAPNAHKPIIAQESSAILWASEEGKVAHFDIRDALNHALPIHSLNVYAAGPKYVVATRPGSNGLVLSRIDIESLLASDYLVREQQTGRPLGAPSCRGGRLLALDDRVVLNAAPAGGRDESYVAGRLFELSHEQLSRQP